MMIDTSSLSFAVILLFSSPFRSYFCRKPMCSRRILIVEDNPVNQKVTELMLRRANCECDIAPHGKIAVEMVQETNYPIVLMDAQMPVMDGATATRWIRDNIPEEFQPKIVVMTASLMDEMKDDWEDVKIDGFLEKPVRLETLVQLIDDMLMPNFAATRATNQ